MARPRVGPTGGAVLKRVESVKTTVYVLLALLLGVGLVFENPGKVAFSLTLWLLIWSWVRTKSPIGGWLFFFYAWTYLGLAGNILPWWLQRGLFDASKWADALQLVAFVLYAAAALTAALAPAAAATLLLYRRTKTNLVRTRHALVLSLGCAALCGILAFVFFRSDPGWLHSAFRLGASSAVWFAYFRASVRVRRVFVSHSWGRREALRPGPRADASSAQELRYVRKRMVLTGLAAVPVTFVALGIIYRGQQATSDLYGLPLLCGVIFAFGSLLLPISRAKRKALNESAPAVARERPASTAPL